MRTLGFCTAILITLSCGESIVPRDKDEREEIEHPHESKHSDQPSDGFALTKQANQAFVKLAQGSLQGSESSNSQAFLAIPYAQPPIGGLRFQPPQAPLAWSGVRDGTKRANLCPQFVSPSLGKPAASIGAEDCLYLNVWRPAKPPATKRAVMVFFHGGSFDNGSSYGPFVGVDWYVGDKLAALGDVIVVTLQYRLGALGFLADPSLRNTAGYSGNYGFLDQIAALEWVKNNIASFGGDPTNVTIFGESAGAASVCNHIAQKYKRGLFKRAILQSGSCQARQVALQESISNDLIEKVGCRKSTNTETRSCLNQLPHQTFTKNQPNFAVDTYAQNPDAKLTWLPVIDGLLYDQDPIEIIRRQEHQKVDTIMGSNRDEIPGLLYFSAGITTTEKLSDALSELGWPTSEQKALLSFYKDKFFAWDKLGAYATDKQFTCPAYELSNLVTTAGNKAFNYRFDASPIPAHGTELSYVFQKNIFVGSTDRAMGEFWTSFAKNGIPTSSATATKWMSHTPAAPRRLIFGSSVTSELNSKAKTCDFLLSSSPFK